MLVISHNVRKPCWRVPPLAECNEISGNIDASNRATATNELSDAFTQEAGPATHIQHTLAAVKSKQLDRLRSLRDDITC
jgi:hypothetical protein